MVRNRYLVAYDIRDPTRLRAIAKILNGFGSRLQYSVFVCDLTMGELCDLRFQIRDTFVSTRDSVAIIPLGAGYDQKLFEFMGVRPKLPTGGARVF